MTDVLSPAQAHEQSLGRPRRKAEGVFYTPEAVVEHLLDGVGYPEARRPSARIADLSCGAGAFLVAAAARLAALLQVQGVSPAKGARILDEALIGLDRDAAAVAVAREQLQAVAAEHGFPGARFPHVRAGDALLREPLPPLTFVVGNPPYLEAKKASPELKDLCRRQFPDVARGAFDLFVCFVAAGLDALEEGGRLGYIVPNKLLVAQYGEALRRRLLAETSLVEITDLSRAGPFRDAAVYPITLTLCKRPPSDSQRVRLRPRLRELSELPAPSEAACLTVAQSDYQRRPRSLIFFPPADPEPRELLARLLALPDRMGDALEFKWTISFHRGGLRDQFIHPRPTGRQPRRLLGGKSHHGNGDVRRYRLDWSGWWIDYDEERARTAGNPLPPAALFEEPKLLIVQNSLRLLAAYDESGFYAKDTFLLARPRPEAAAVNLHALLGLLNSRLASFYYQHVFHGTRVAAGYLHYLSGYLADLPLIPSLANDADLARLARRCEEAVDDPSAFAAAEAALDEHVADAFGLSARERRLVTDEVGPETETGTGRRGRWRASDQ